jgi:hypothetical protein
MYFLYVTNSIGNEESTLFDAVETCLPNSCVPIMFENTDADTTRWDLFLLKPHFIWNLYIYILQIGVRIGCNGLVKGTD